jgi:hypothetical protein
VVVDPDIPADSLQLKLTPVAVAFTDSVPQGVALFQVQANLYFNGFTLNTFSAIGLLSSNTIPSTRTSLFSSRSGESIASSS